MKVFVLMAFAALSACSVFGSGRPRPPDPTELIVTGVPAGSRLYVDGLPSGSAVAFDDHSQVIHFAPGAHIVEVHAGDRVVYREETYAAAGERHIVTVLSGSTR